MSAHTPRHHEEPSGRTLNYSTGKNVARIRGDGSDPRSAAQTLFLHAVLLLLAVLFLIPFVWLICAAFKQPDDIFSYAFLPWHDLHRLTLDNFRQLFHDQPF